MKKKRVSTTKDKAAKKLFSKPAIGKLPPFCAILSTYAKNEMATSDSTITAYLDKEIYGDSERVVFLAQEDVLSLLELREIGQQLIVTYIK